MSATIVLSSPEASVEKKSIFLVITSDPNDIKAPRLFMRLSHKDSKVKTTYIKTDTVITEEAFLKHPLAKDLKLHFLELSTKCTAYLLAAVEDSPYTKRIYGDICKRLEKISQG